MKLGVAIAATAALLAASAGSGSASAATYNWFFSTGDSAGGVFQTNGAGDVVSGVGTFNTSAGSYQGTILPGAGNDGFFTWNNRFPPLDVYGLLYHTADDSERINLWKDPGTAGLGTTSGAILGGNIPGQPNYNFYDVGTLTVANLGSDQYAWFFGTGETAGGQFTTDATGDVLSGWAIVNTTGGSYQTTILPGAGNDGFFTWNNRFPPLDVYGLLYHTADDSERINLWKDPGTAGLGTTSGAILGGNIPGQPNYNFYDVGTLTVYSATPETGVWALMVGGFALAGAALRRRRAIVAG